ncbi:DUF4012 domain-containing protein [Skermania sp. ID1734]|uniref:DUF4012 domain-containing protein n=1 Tax=Skermania sp. ID1734 TaxID=2597516 RepID=UPI0021020F8F|nr:DUF4012 domain-containing protein [Skermania sp. ID1734]
MAWLLFCLLRVYFDLNSTKNDAESAKSAMLNGDTAKAHDDAASAEASAEAAVRHTDTFTWNTAENIPWLGGAFTSIEQMAGVVHSVAQQILIPAVDVGEALSPKTIVHPGGSVNLAPLRASVPRLQSLANSADQVQAQAKQVDAAPIWLVNNARTGLIDEVTNLTTMLHNSALGAQLAPAMLGADGPRSYFIGFTTPAEARGTGGLLGGFGILNAVNGHVAVAKVASNSAFPFNGLKPIDLGPEFAAQWSGGGFHPTTDFRNSNFSANFPFAARIWQSMWEQQSGGKKVDGVVATDPVALSYVLGAVGPVTLKDGEQVTADNVVKLTMSTAYVRFATDNAARKQYLEDIADAVVSKMTSKIEHPQALLEALGRAATERRILVWSEDPAIEALLEKTPLAHDVPEDKAPYAQVILNNQGGNKMDYYITRDMSWTATDCSGPTRTSTVTVKLTNTAPPEVANYPDYVAGTFDNRGTPKATAFPVVTLYATEGAKVSKVTVDGKPLPFPLVGTERQRQIFTAPTVIPRGKTVEVQFQYTEPTEPGKVRFPVQPLVDQPEVDVDVAECAPK